MILNTENNGPLFPFHLSSAYNPGFPIRQVCHRFPGDSGDGPLVLHSTQSYIVQTVFMIFSQRYFYGIVTFHSVEAQVASLSALIGSIAEAVVNSPPSHPEAPSMAHIYINQIADLWTARLGCKGTKAYNYTSVYWLRYRFIQVVPCHKIPL